MNRVKEAALLAIGLVVLGLCIKWGIDDFANKDRTVTVKGLAEKEVAADKVTWPIQTKELGDDLPSLYTKINATTDKVKRFLKQNGVKDEEISVNAPEVVDLQAERYGSDNHRYRYNITSTVTVTSHNVKLVRGIIARQGELLRQGVAVVDGGYGNGVTYEYVSFQKMKPEMMEEAIKNAEKTAQQFADNSNSELGKIMSASQGQFSIDDRDANTPYIKNVRGVITVTYSLKEDVARLNMGTFYAGKGEYDLWVVEGDEVRKRRVVLGENSFEYVEVVGGLKEGERVIVSDMNRNRDRERLKIR